MDESLTTLQIMKKTYLFVLLRFIVIIGTIVPIAGVAIYYANFFFRFFDLHVEGMVYKIFWLNFAWIGCAIGVGIFGVVRKTILFYIKAAHVIAITKLCIKDQNEAMPSSLSLTLSSIGDMMKRFISVNVFMVADGLLLQGIEDVGTMLLTQDLIPALNPNNPSNSFFGKLKNLGLKVFGGMIKTTLMYCDEIVLSYMYVRTYVKEITGVEEENGKRPGRKHTKEGKKKATIKELFGYAVDGICLFMRKCLPLMKRALMVVIQVKIFGWIVSIISCIVIFTILGNGIIRTLTVFIALRVIFALVSYTFIEPYETVALLTRFYEVYFEDDEEGEKETEEEMKKKLIGFSMPFKKMVAKAQGKEEAEMGESTKTSGPVLKENILDVAKGAFESSVLEDDNDGEQTFDNNINSLNDDSTE